MTARTAYTSTVTLPGNDHEHEVEVRPYGEVSAEVFLQRDGRLLGTMGVYGDGSDGQPAASMMPATVRRSAFYRFADEQAALRALVSYALRGYWQDEA